MEPELEPIEKKQEPEPEPLGKKIRSQSRLKKRSRAGDGAAKKLAGSPALQISLIDENDRRTNCKINNIY